MQLQHAVKCYQARVLCVTIAVQHVLLAGKPSVDSITTMHWGSRGMAADLQLVAGRGGDEVVGLGAAQPSLQAILPQPHCKHL